MAKHKTLEKWSSKDSRELYGIRNWSEGYFDIAQNGDLLITPFRNARDVGVSIPEIIGGLRERGMGMPVLLRIENILESQITRLHQSFRKAVRDLGYTGQYRGVYPIKVNQQSQVVERIADFGSRFHHGLEVGSKAELIAAVSQLKDRDALLICNGYKDEEFLDLGLYAVKMGFACFFVLEMGQELELLLERSAALGVRPLIGIRVKLSTKAGGHWTDSAGDRGIFGMTSKQVVDVVERLKSCDMLDCLQLLHYHIGSQIPNIRDIRTSVIEATRFYAGLVQEGANMRYIDLGGGLAVDYDGSNTNYHTSRNYSMDEYCADIIETVMSICDDQSIEHPTIITESGRALVAYYSVLLFNVLSVNRFEGGDIPESIPEEDPESVHNLLEVYNGLTLKNLQEGYNDAIYYRDEVRQLFRLGQVTLRQRASAEDLFWGIFNKIAQQIDQLKQVPKELEDIKVALADIYYGNFSVFQSLPDSWAIDHLFPIMPVHRLNELPSRQATIADITCDADGRINRFIDIHGVKQVLDLHETRPDEEYYLGVFLVGAYQETLGDLHNLLGDTNIVSIRIDEEGGYDFVRELEGESVAEVLSYVEYDPKHLVGEIREAAEHAIREGRISTRERYQIMKAFDKGLRGYTYFEK